MGMTSMVSSIWLLVFLCGGVVFASNDEGFALLSMKGSITEDPEGTLSNWNSSEDDPCLWNGIACREGKVISISLPKAGLSGVISPSLGSLRYLRHINLRNNRFSGTLHSRVFAAQGLQSFVLYGNLLSGTLPPEIGNLSALQILDFSHNLLGGSIPTSLLRCTKLRVLVLSHNNLSGPLPARFGNSFPALEKLDLSFNRLNGPIPADIGALSNLQGTVDFSHNLFSGSIPTSLGNLSERVYIDLTYNNLSGPIPKNGALVNRGPSAFIGNPSLCGPPLKNPCFSSIAPIPPNSSNVGYNRGGLERSVVTAIAVGDAAAICIIAMVFYCFYQRAVSSKTEEEERRLGKVPKRWKGFLCFGKDGEAKLCEDLEQIDLIPLDKEVYFDLDELLKASAVVLGKSGLGIVYKVVLEDGLTLAVRRLGEGGSQRFKEFQREVEDIGRIRHPNIVPLRAYYWSFEEKLLIYDYIPARNLSAAIHGEEEGFDFSPLAWDLRTKIMQGMAKGLAYLHEFSPKKYVHGDINPNNILLGLDMEPHLSDFRLARLADIASRSPCKGSKKKTSTKSQSSDSAVSPSISTRSCYWAPEALKGMKPTQKWDVYSYGVVLLELISGKSPAIMLDTLQMDIVRWFHLCIEERKPLVDVLDPFLAQEPEKEDQIIAVLKIALACVQPGPERRPHMRSVTESLQRLLADQQR